MKRLKTDGYTLMKMIYKRFGERFFITCLPFKNGKSEVTPSTFGKDNIIGLDGWLLIMKAKMFSGKIDGISVVIRVFLDEKINVPSVGVPIPKKNLYHLCILKDTVILFDKEETFDAQNTDHVTDMWIEP